MVGQPCPQQMVVGTEKKETGLELESSGGDDKEEDEDGEEGEVTPPPHSLSPKDLPSLGDIFSRQAGIFIGTPVEPAPNRDRVIDQPAGGTPYCTGIS
jgi:hypothetical protein